MTRSAVSAAFPHTIPVFMGYLSIGFAFGIMLQAIGYNPLWAVFMSLIIYAGSGQYLGVTLLNTGAPLSQVALLTLLLNFRHIFYGLSLLEQFKNTGWRKPYMIFALTDETYALLTSLRVPLGVDPSSFYMAVCFLNHCYWILGSFIGAAVGSLIQINTQGVDFAMTALFVVIAVEQWKSAGVRGIKNHLPALIGVGCTVVSLVIFGPDNMLIPALIAISVLLLLLRKRLERREEVAV